MAPSLRPLSINSDPQDELRDRTVTLGPGELFVVPKCVEHRPAAREEVHLLLIEPKGAPNTADAATAARRTLA